MNEAKSFKLYRHLALVCAYALFLCECVCVCVCECVCVCVCEGGSVFFFFIFLILLCDVWSSVCVSACNFFSGAEKVTF